MNVFIYELKQYKKSIIAWSIAVAVTMLVLLSATPLFIEESGAMKEMLAAIPQSVKEAMGVSALESLFSPVGFYSYIFLYISLMASIQAMNLGLGIISKENRMKTADFLMSKPKSRAGIYLQKLLAALIALAITEAAFLLSATLAMIWQSDGDLAVKPFIFISLTFIFIQLMFLSIGLLLAALIRKIKSTITVTMGVCFGAFMLGMIGEIAGSKVMRYFSPLKYFDNSYIIMHGAYETRYLIIAAALTFILALASFGVYIKKDVLS